MSERRYTPRSGYLRGDGQIVPIEDLFDDPEGGEARRHGHAYSKASDARYSASEKAYRVSQDEGKKLFSELSQELKLKLQKSFDDQRKDLLTQAKQGDQTRLIRDNRKIPLDLQKEIAQELRLEAANDKDRIVITNILLKISRALDGITLE